MGQGLGIMQCFYISCVHNFYKLWCELSYGNSLKIRKTINGASGIPVICEWRRASSQWSETQNFVLTLNCYSFSYCALLKLYIIGSQVLQLAIDLEKKNGSTHFIKSSILEYWIGGSSCYKRASNIYDILYVRLYLILRCISNL